MGSLSKIIESIDSLLMETSASIPQPEPGGLELSTCEWDLYESHARAEDHSFVSAIKVLNFLKEKLGYERIKEDVQVRVHFRPHGSDKLVKPFDGKNGKVIGVDEMGRPWVQFTDKEWTKATSTSKVKSSGVSPFESGEFENIQPRMKAVRLDPLDIQEYRSMLAKIGYQPLKFGEVERKTWDYELPTGEEEEDSCTEEDSAEQECDSCGDEEEEDAGEEECDSCGDEHRAYFYDPLVTDLVQMSNEQLRYVLDNAEDFLPNLDEDYEPDKKKPRFEEWNVADGGAFGSIKEIDATIDLLDSRVLHIDALVKKLAADKIPRIDYPVRGISPGSMGIWKKMMQDKNFVENLHKRPPGAQWGLAHYVFTLRALKAKKKPFSYWSPAHEKVFMQKHAKIQLNLKHKRAFKKKAGETPESFHKRTGRCPPSFMWLSERNRCIHKMAA